MHGLGVGGVRFRWFHSPGWYGLRTGPLYWVLRDVRRNPLRFTERNRIGTRRIGKRGAWEFWLK
jgi:hypothetical protein